MSAPFAPPRQTGDIIGQELQSDKAVQLYILGFVDDTHPPPPSFSTMR
jgi:hypothetical protein